MDSISRSGSSPFCQKAADGVLRFAMILDASEAELPPRFKKGAALGSGFCGVVWAAKDRSNGGRAVAVKSLPRSVYERHRLSYPPLEVSLAVELSHENVGRVYDVLYEPERILLIQECLMGGDLFTCMQESGLFSEFLARCCFSDILAGIEYIHERGVVHRDLKPENCALDAKGTVKILDFGLAARFVPGQLLYEFCGSPEYAAPEVLQEQPHEGPPIDVWALGVMLFDMVMGRLPFDRGSGSFNVLELDVELTSELQLLLKQILRVDPKKRATVKEIKECEWLRLAVCVDESSELELMSCGESTASITSSMSFSDESPLKRRLSSERENLVKREIDFGPHKEMQK
jgi:5'-AMP-activated protein kinase catalytic alpha subunit